MSQAADDLFQKARVAGHGPRNLIVIRLVKEFYCMCDRFALPLVTATFWPNLIFASTFVCLATPHENLMLRNIRRSECGCKLLTGNRKPTPENLHTCIQQPVEVNFLNVPGMARPHEGFGSFHISLICTFPDAAAVSDCYKGFLSMLLLPEIFQPVWQPSGQIGRG